MAKRIRYNTMVWCVATGKPYIMDDEGWEEGYLELYCYPVKPNGSPHYYGGYYAFRRSEVTTVKPKVVRQHPKSEFKESVDPKKAAYAEQIMGRVQSGPHLVKD